MQEEKQKYRQKKDKINRRPDRQTKRFAVTERQTQKDREHARRETEVQTEKRQDKQTAGQTNKKIRSHRKTDTETSSNYDARQARAAR